jgi:gluconate kinase
MKDKADLERARNDYRIAKYQAKTEREAMRRDYAEVKRQQNQDYTYNWANMQNDYRYERAQQRVDKMVKNSSFGSQLISGLVIAGGAAAVGALTNNLVNRLSKPNP